nr:MAG TPA: hypothetical protein [Caudoviricetes sp.]
MNPFLTTRAPEAMLIEKASAPGIRLHRHRP